MVRKAFVALFGLIACISLAFSETPPEVRVVFMEDLKPSCWEENSQPHGILPDLTITALSSLGIRAIPEFYPWKRAQSMVELGTADLMVTIPNTTRFQYAVFGREQVFIDAMDIFIRKGNKYLEQKLTGVRSLAELKPFLMVTYLGDGWTAENTKRADGFKYFEVPEIEQIPLAIALGRADMTLRSSFSMNYWTKVTGLSDQIEELSTQIPATRFHYVFMVSRKSPWALKGLVRALDQALKAMKNSGEWQEILRKYNHPGGFGHPFQTQLETDEFYDGYADYPIYNPFLK